MATFSLSLTKQLGTSALLTIAIMWLIEAVVSAQSPPAQPRPANAPLQSQRPGTMEGTLVKNALVAVNHANITGNFTVLRDLGSTSFRQKNSAGDLAAIFKNLRDRKIDLSPILSLDPQFTEQPTVDQAGYLKLVGYFPTQPLQVRFALAFQRVEAGWMIDTISVGVIDPTAAQAAANSRPPAAQPAAPSAQGNQATAAPATEYTFPARQPATTANAAPASRLPPPVKR